MKKFVSVIVVVCITLFIINRLRKEAQRNYDIFFKNEIKGVIDSIRYGDKSQVIVVIVGREISLLLFDIREGDGLIAGDSIYKGKNSKILELHSKNSNGGYIYTKDFKMK